MYTLPKTFSREKARGQTGTFVALFFAIVIGFFFTQDQYYSYLGNTESLAQARAEAQKKENTLASLNTTEKRPSSDQALRDSMERYAWEYREDVIMNSLFSPQSGISISEISMSKGDRLPSGLSLANISLSVRAGDLISLTNYLDYLTNKPENKRSYVVKSLSFPFDSASDGAQNVSLELGMYYFNPRK